ncbi:MAG: peroxiredoxin [Deltaproteobacteria bacterium]|nr:peroxiredoxin [Deltaproteobacteria bacterium]MBP6832902.1 peroxiredoxin [Deltaproteobacteria bacterium]
MRATAAAMGMVMALGCSRSSAPPPPAPVVATQATAAAPAPAAAAEAQAPAAATLTVSAPAREAMIAAGEAAPSFRATTHEGSAVESDGGARSRVLVLYFYPRDETPGCTREACSFRDAFSAYSEAGADVVGVSTDSAEAHRGFAQHHRLPFGLIADTDGRLAGAFGVPVSSGYTARTTVVIGRDGRVARVFPNVRVDGHSDEVLAAVRAAR